MYECHESDWKWIDFGFAAVVTIVALRYDNRLTVWISCDWSGNDRHQQLISIVFFPLFNLRQAVNANVLCCFIDSAFMRCRMHEAFSVRWYADSRENGNRQLCCLTSLLSVVVLNCYFVSIALDVVVVAAAVPRFISYVVSCGMRRTHHRQFNCEFVVTTATAFEFSNSVFDTWPELNSIDTIHYEIRKIVFAIKFNSKTQPIAVTHSNVIVIWFSFAADAVDWNGKTTLSHCLVSYQIRILWA